MKIAGLDIGTTGCKLTVFDENGCYLGKTYRDYPIRRAVSGHEIDISAMMESVYAVIGEMAAKYPDIAGIGVTSFGETFVMTDENGEPLIGAGVMVEGTTIGTITGIDGDYVLTVPADAAKLVFSFIGLADQTIEMNGQTEIESGTEVAKGTTLTLTATHIMRVSVRKILRKIYHLKKFSCSGILLRRFNFIKIK